MKKIGIWLFIAFVLIGGIYAVIQGDIGRNFTRNLLTNALQKSGFEVTIDHIDGTIPHNIRLKGVTLRGNGLDVSIEELQLRVTLWRLIDKELAFHQVHAKGAGFEFDGKFRLNKKYAYLSGKIGEWTFASRFERAKKVARFTARSPLLRANFAITSEGDAYAARGTWQIPKLQLKGNGNVAWKNRTLQGELSAGKLAKATLDLQVNPDGLLTGTTNLAVDNLQALRLPHIYGKLNGKAEWSVSDGVQMVQFDATATDFYYDTLFAQKASVYSDLQDPFHNLSGLIDLELQKAKWNGMELETLSLETTKGKGDSPFKLFAEGKWKHPLEVYASGTWKDDISIDIEDLSGTFFNHPFILTSPVQFEWTNSIFRLPDVEISIAGATAAIHVDRNQDRTDARLRLVHIPIDFLSLNPLDVSVNGTLNLEADVHEKNGELKGDLKAAIEQMEVASLGISDKLNAAGTFEGHFNRDLLNLKGSLAVREDPVLKLDLALPIHFSLWPFDASLLPHKSTKGHIAFNGRAEDFIDFLNLGPHRLEGQCNCDITFSNTLYRPLVDGYLFFEDGFYQNYYTGTELHDIQAEFFAEKNIVYLRSFNAQDRPKTGAVSAHGQAHLLQADHYPFHLDVVLSNLKFAEIDLVGATANGKVHIEGNTISSLVQGDIHVLKTDVAIPDHIPNPLPNLQVVYLNPIHPVPPPETAYTPYPLHLDLHVFAPDAVTISGRGLNSEWSGDFHLGGTYTDPAIKGKLDLIDGSFSFSSREFKLIEGSLSLSGAEHEMPLLNLAGSMETHGINITARLQGPINNPQITLQSVPPLPLGSIMSYLLFGQDLSEIGGFQALQLATSLAKLAGTGPDVMENTRRSLGIDRLRVITDPSEEGGETVSLQVGKYVSKGVLVSFTQGTEDSSTDVSVEIELKGNFVFQIESDQRQEQGIFTLKWNLNY